ncbi:LOW QUALITY PROTEIN: EF-hand calcium-binding domain-containing protein 6 [Cyanocitta cristata]
MDVVHILWQLLWNDNTLTKESSSSGQGLQFVPIKYEFAATSVSSVPDPTFFSWDIGQILLQKIVDKEDELEKKKHFRCLMRTQRLLKHFKSVLVEEKDVSRCSAYQDIEKAFREIDVSQSGFVSLDYLKSVINGFIFPLPNEIFQELMNRFGLKATGKIVWQQFEKFQDPGSSFENKQTIPMRKHKHKTFYKMILDNLKIAILPGDLSGSSSHISKEIQQRQEKRQTELSKNRFLRDIHGKAHVGRQEHRTAGDVLATSSIQSGQQISQKTRCLQQMSPSEILIEDQTNKAQNRTVDEVIKRLKDKEIQQAATIEDMLEDHGMSMDDSQFNLLLVDKLGLPDAGLSYLDFVQAFCRLFHTQEAKEVLPWLLPSHKKKQMITDAELACDHTHYYLVIKARTRWHDLVRSFQGFDSEGNGMVQPRDLKKFLFPFGIPITLERSKQLWASGNNRKKKALHVKEIKNQTQDKFRDYFQDFNNAFHKDKNRDGYAKICGLHRTLQEFNPYLDDDHFSSFLNSLGISIHDSKLSYFDFLRAIEGGRASEYQQKQKQAAPPASFAVLILEQMLIKIKETIPEVLTPGFNTVAQEFQDIYSSKDNTVSKRGVLGCM